MTDLKTWENLQQSYQNLTAKFFFAKRLKRKKIESTDGQNLLIGHSVGQKQSF